MRAGEKGGRRGGAGGGGEGGGGGGSHRVRQREGTELLWTQKRQFKAGHISWKKSNPFLCFQCSPLRSSFPQGKNA